MLIDFSGYIVLVAILLWLGCILYLKFKQRKTNTYLIFFSIFYVYICGVLNYTQFPIFIDDTMKNEIGQNVWRDMNLVPFDFRHMAIAPSLLNIVLTIPLGFGIPFIVKIKFKQIFLLGVSIGLLIESLQLGVALLVGFTFRYVDVNDVIFNVSGTILGYSLFKIVTINFRVLIDTFDIPLNPIFKYIYETK